MSSPPHGRHAVTDVDTDDDDDTDPIHVISSTPNPPSGKVTEKAQELSKRRQKEILGLFVASNLLMPPLLGQVGDWLETYQRTAWVARALKRWGPFAVNAAAYLYGSQVDVPSDFQAFFQKKIAVLEKREEQFEKAMTEKESELKRSNFEFKKQMAEINVALGGVEEQYADLDRRFTDWSITPKSGPSGDEVGYIDDADGDPKRLSPKG